ncbi:hypothetical protein [Deinococcus alpinitundrae]|uniref:hypothetical protein n=1 Tax=Deinococcus alpinitundrae TaxID=468913 RepID=UPI0013797E88|nr:hypothetical protein [Deinococcus alpinitundrae]
MSGVELEVILNADQPQEAEIFRAWAGENGLDVDVLSNAGCGCCVDIYSLFATPQAARVLDSRLRAVGSGVNFKA